MCVCVCVCMSLGGEALHIASRDFGPPGCSGGAVGPQGASSPRQGTSHGLNPLGDEREGRRGFSHRVPAATGCAGPLRGSALLLGELAERRRLAAVRPSSRACTEAHGRHGPWCRRGAWMPTPGRWVFRFRWLLPMRGCPRLVHGLAARLHLVGHCRLMRPGPCMGLRHTKCGGFLFRCPCGALSLSLPFSPSSSLSLFLSLSASLGGGPPASAVDPFILRRNEQK